MNAFASPSAVQALFLANERSQQLIAEADARRMANLARQARPSRIAAALASIRAVFQAADTSSESTVVPHLDDYPYRS